MRLRRTVDRSLPGWGKLALVVVTALLALAGSAQGSVKSKMLYSRGVIELNAGRTQAALDLFNQAVAEDPSDGYALYYRGVTRGQLGDHDGAISDLTAALNAQPTLKRAALELGIALVQKEEFDDAMPLLERARESPELKARASFFLGVCRLRRGEYNRSRQLFETAAAADEKLANSAHYYEGIIAYRQGDRPKAIEHFQAVVDKAPESQIAGEARKLIEALETTARPWQLYAGTAFQWDSNVELGPNSTVPALGGGTAEFISGKSDGRWLFNLGGSYRLLDWERVTLALGYDFYQSLHFQETQFNIQNHAQIMDLQYSTNYVDMGVAARHDFTLRETDKFLQSGTVLPWVSVPTGEWAETQASFRFLVNDFYGGVEAGGNDADFDLRDAYNYAGALREVFDLGAARYLWLGYRFDQEDPVGDTDTGSQAFAYDGHQVETGFSWTLPSAYGMEGGYSYRYELYDNASREPDAMGDPTLPQRRDNIHGVYFLIHVPLPAFFEPVNFEMTCGVLSTFNNSNQTAFDYERLVGLISVTARL
jgi:tetratricopeptide (TPR) repeat protein